MDKSDVIAMKDAGKEKVREVAEATWVGWATRLGFIVRGILYLTVGYLAIQVAAGGRGRLTDQQGAIQAIAASPFGDILLLIVALGLLGYSLWGVIRAIMNPYRLETNLKGVVQRAGYLLSAGAYFILLIPTVRYLFNLGGGGGNSEQKMSQSVLAQPWGPWALGIIGIGLIGFGAGQAINAMRKNFGEQFDRFKLDTNQQSWVRALGRLGTVARGAVFTVLGILLITAAATLDASQVGGMDGALRALARQPYGGWLLALVALD